MKHIVIYGRVPSKKNSKSIIYNKKTGRPFIVSSKNHAEWHKDALIQIAGKRIGLVPKVERIELLFFPPDNHKADLTNKSESVMDVLVDAGVLMDDNWFVVPSVKADFGGKDAENPRVDISIYDV